MLELSTIQQIAVWLLPVLFAITLHEAAHAWAASRCGDNTAVILGRLSFNPIKHIDLLGTIIIPIVVLILSHFNFVFGWAKPVPINSNNFKHPTRDTVLVTGAGPFSNILMAIFWAIVLKIASLTSIHYHLSSNIILFFLLAGNAGILINLLLAFLNLIPILPLDGGRILSALLPYRIALAYQKLEPFGFLIVMALLVTGALGLMIGLPMEFSLSLLKSIFNI